MADPLSDDYWEAQDEAMLAIILPVIVATATQAARLAFDDLVLQFGGELGVSWDVVNEAAKDWARGYTFDLVKGINETSRAFLQEEIAGWIESGAPLQELIDSLVPMFGEVRAEMIGTSEATRIFHYGNVTTWEESGVVSGYTFRTVYDDLVCPVCEPDNGVQYPLDDTEHAPSRHTRCRCYSTPVLIKKKMQALVDELVYKNTEATLSISV